MFLSRPPRLLNRTACQTHRTSVSTTNESHRPGFFSDPRHHQAPTADNNSGVNKDYTDPFWSHRTVLYIEIPVAQETTYRRVMVVRS